MIWSRGSSLRVTWPFQCSEQPGWPARCEIWLGEHQEALVWLQVRKDCPPTHPQVILVRFNISKGCFHPRPHPQPESAEGGGKWSCSVWRYRPGGAIFLHNSMISFGIWKISSRWGDFFLHNSMISSGIWKISSRYALQYSPGYYLSVWRYHLSAAIFWLNIKYFVHRPTSLTRIVTCRTKIFSALPGSHHGVPKLGRYSV